MDNSTSQKDHTYVEKVWIKGSIFALIVVLLLILKTTFSVILLILAGILVAVFFHGLSGLICSKTHWKRGICTFISVIGTIAIIVGLLWLIGSKIASQFTQLSETLPATLEKAKDYLNQSALGQKIVERATSPDSMRKAEAIAQTFFKSTFGVFGDVYIVLFVGIFFIVSPKTYVAGMIEIVPKKGQDKAHSVLDKLGNNLKKWLKGKIFAMFVVFVLTSIGLLILGVPLWLVLAIIAGLLNFIPNFGPLIAMIPAVLIGLLQGPTTALIIAGMYIFIQFVESNLITPTVQQRLVSIPPALIIIAQLIVSPLTGGWGLVLATPLILIVMILVQELYIKPNNQEVDLKNN